MTPGAGAAGGLGYAFLMFLHARLRPGIDIVFDEIHLKERIKNVLGNTRDLTMLKPDLTSWEE